MSYTDNAPLITAWNTRVQALKDRIETLYDGTSHNVLIEDTTVETMLLSSMSLDGTDAQVLTLENPELVSVGQAPTITHETPTLVVEPEDEGSEDDQEEEKEDTVDETVEEPSEETEEDETKEEENE